MRPRSITSRPSGFTLVEVVLALAIFSFVAAVLVGLISVGINTNKESVEELEATNLIQSYLAARRGAPLAETISGCPLPRLDTAASVTDSNPLYVDAQGALCEKTAARFGLTYRISPPGASTKVSIAHVCLFWPPQSPSGGNRSYCESTGYFLPQ